MNASRITAIVAVLAALACNREPTPPGPNPIASAPAPGAAPGPAPAPAPSPSPSPNPPADPADSWLLVNKGGVDLGIIELRAGKPPKLTLEVESADATALKTKLDQIDGPEGIALDMHLPPPSGKGRGPYGSRIVKYDDPLYKNAIQDRLERDFSVKQIPVLHDPLPPEAFKQLHISRERDKVGSIDFSTTPPKVTLITDKSERLGLENNWEMVQKRDPLLVRFVQPSGPTGTLVTLKAKPGDAAYPRAVALFLMTERYYLARHAYRLEFQK